MAAGDLFDAAEELLGFCEALLTGDGAPIERSYVSQGDPVDACDTLTVRVAQIGERALASAVPGQQHRTGRQNEVSFTVRVVRCLPTTESGDPASEAEQEAFSERAYRDAWIIWNGLMAAKRANLILEGYCSAFEEDFALPTPNLTYGGWEISLRAVLFGYTPDLST